MLLEEVLVAICDWQNKSGIQLGGNLTDGVDYIVHADKFRFASYSGWCFFGDETDLNGKEVSVNEFQDIVLSLASALADRFQQFGVTVLYNGQEYHLQRD